MKIIPTLRAPAVVRPAVSFSFVFCPILLALLAGRGLAQTSIPGYTPAAPKLKQNLSHEEKARRGAAPLSRIHPEIKIESARAHRLPALTPSEMRPERKSMRLRVGAIRRLDRPLAAQNDATFIQTPEGKLYVMRLTSEGAAMTRLHFSGVALPAGARLFVYSRTNPDAYHALHIPGEDGLDVTGRSEFWTPPIAGAEVVVEYIAPATTPDEPPAQPPFVIDLVSHILLDPRAARSSVGSQQNSPGLCNENVPAEWGEAAKSVGLFQFTTPKGEFACSGILLNNARNDGTPYFLTANHCLSRNDYSTSLRVYWLYDSGDSPTSQTPQSSGGAVIATGVAGDFTLLQLPYAPPGVRFAGWTAESPAASTPVTSIHHPQASYKRFSSGQTVAGACPSGLQGGCEQYLPVRWQSGITEPGSSGAPLFVGSSSDPRVAGLLSGGLSSCSNRTGLDFYSRFDLAFTAIAPYLTGQGCAFTLQPVKRPPGANDPQTREIFSATGGDGSVNLKVRTGTDCSWTAQSEAPWITLTSPASGSGEVTITYTVAPHTDTQPRSGYLLIAGHRLLVTQMGVSNCAASAASLGQSFNGALSGANCRSALDQRAYADHYTFTGQAGQQLILEMYSSFFDTFLLLLGPDGKLVEYNDDISFASNSVIPGTGGHLELTASGDYTVEATSFGPAETGSYTLDIKRVCSLRFTQEPALIPAAGGNGRLNVTAPPACQWTAQSQVNWLTINSGAGDGNGAITFTAAPNPDVGSDNTARPREGPLAIMTNSGSLTTSVKQNYNCGFRVGPKSISIPPSTALSESSIFTGLGVSTGATCTWTATSNAPWLEFGQGGSI